MAVHRFQCLQIHESEVPFGAITYALPENCPKFDTLSSKHLYPPGTHRGSHCRRRNFRGRLSG